MTPTTQAIIVLFFLGLIGLISTLAAIFLISEFKKKFTFMKNFIAASPLFRQHYYPGNKALEIKKGMRNIVLRSQTQEDFSALIGLQLEMFGLSGFDYYGFASSQGGKIVFQLYLGSGELYSQFILNKDIKVQISSTDNDQLLKPDAVYPPHWWQRLGFYS